MVSVGAKVAFMKREKNLPAHFPYFCTKSVGKHKDDINPLIARNKNLTDMKPRKALVTTPTM